MSDITDETLWYKIRFTPLRDALRGRLEDELRDDVIRIRGVSHGVRCAQQHLQADVRNGLANAALAKRQPSGLAIDLP